MEGKVVFDTGPLIHLDEIKLVKCLELFKNIYIPNEVNEELKRNKTYITKKIKIINLEGKFKDFAKILFDKYSLDLGESQAIALTLQEKAEYFFTDDLDAREVSKNYNIKTHGTAGIILRAFRERIINKEMAIKKINELYEKSSLFITKEIINQIINTINEFNKKIK